MYGCKAEEVTSYLDEFQWFKIHARGQPVDTIMATFLRHVTEWPNFRYNPENN